MCKKKNNFKTKTKIKIKKKAIQTNPKSNANRMDDFFLYNEEEEGVSRNYLMLLEDRFSAKSLDETESLVESSSSTFGNKTKIASSSTSANNTSNSKKFKHADKLIIKAKVYILEILEVFYRDFKRIYKSKNFMILIKFKQKKI